MRRYFFSRFLGILHLRAFLKPEKGFPGTENELGAGATLREAKGIVGALCKSSTPTDGSFSVLALLGHVLRCGMLLERFQSGKQPRRLRAPAPSSNCPPQATHASLYRVTLSIPLLRVVSFCSTEATKQHRLEPLP